MAETTMQKLKDELEHMKFLVRTCYYLICIVVKIVICYKINLLCLHLCRLAKENRMLNILK